MWGVVFSFAALGWRYNSVLIVKGVLISLGVSLIVRAFIPKSKPQNEKPAVPLINRDTTGSSVTLAPQRSNLEAQRSGRAYFVCDR